MPHHAPVPTQTHPAPVAMPVSHYENFPVASWLCPPRLRRPIAAVYHFARTADDIADEGDASPTERLTALAAYRAALHGNAAASHAGGWPQVFGPLHEAVGAHQLPLQCLDDLLDAFEQDTRKTAAGAGYANEAELMDYCRRSANPVGRLLLHLYGVNDPLALQRSDAICSALQLINFWQDLSVDLPRGRYYVPHDVYLRFGLTQSTLVAAAAQGHTPENATILIANLVNSARALMLFGAPLVHQVSGRAGWELRLVVQGGLRILDRITALNYNTLAQRPRLRKRDYALMVWRALWM